MNEPVSSIMIPFEELITHNPETSMVTVQRTMERYRLHHLPIVVENHLKGLITGTDLLRLNRRFEEYDGLFARDVMTTRLAKLEPNAKVGTALTIFLENLFHLLPIVDGENNLLGIITTFDVLKFTYKKEYPGDDFPFV